MEMFDLYDNQGALLDKTAYRGSSLEDGEYHLVVHIWIRNKDGLYLIQRRNKKTDLIPHMWAATAGAAQTGDTSLNAAIRETFEEIGLVLNESELKLLKRYYIKHPKASYITDLYLVERDVLLNDLILDKLEVSECDYKSLEEIKEMIINKSFWDYSHLLEREDYLEILEKS